MAKRTSSKELEAKKELAFIYFMQGESQKNICERFGLVSKTLGRWVESENWKEKKAAHNITRTELVNKTLICINNMLESAVKDKDYKIKADDLIKMATSIEKLDKKSTVVNDIEVFMNFNRWLLARMQTDNTLTGELVKAVNRFQDSYVNERISNK